MKVYFIIVTVTLLSFTAGSSVITFESYALSSEWKTIKTWSGAGITNTEPFEIESEVWRVIWTSEASDFSKDMGGAGHIFQLYLQKPGDELFIDILANVANEVHSSNTSYVYHKGRFYLKMNGGNGNWEVSVQIPK